MRRYSLLALPILSLILFFTPAAMAQRSLASIVGRVLDPTGAPIPAARIAVVNANTGETRRMSSFADGGFAVPELAPGFYNITVDKEGFRKLEQRNLELQVDETARAEFRLEIGALAQTMEVTATAVLLNTENASRGQVVGAGDIRDMPLANRNFLDLAYYSAGVAQAEEGGQGQFAINGARSDNTGFLVDGQTNRDPNQGNAQISPALAAVEEFKVITSNYSAEYGRFGGGVISLALKSGANRFHGTVFEYIRNNFLDARSFFDNELPKLRQNQFGASLNGPVMLPRIFDGRNRTFFLVSWEETRNIAGQNLLTRVPTVAERSGDYSAEAGIFLKDPLATGVCNATNRAACFPGNRVPASRIDPLAQRLMGDLIPLPNNPGNVNNFRSYANVPNDTRNLVFKVDQRFAEKDSLSVKYLTVPNATEWPFWKTSVPGFTVNANSRNSLVNASETHMFTPTLLNEIRAGLSRTAQMCSTVNDGVDAGKKYGLNWTTQDANYFGYPEFNIRGLFGTGTLGDTGFAPQWYVSNNYQFSDTLTWVKTHHLMKFGVDYLSSQYAQVANNPVRGQLYFQGKFTNDPFGDFLLGMTQSAKIQLSAIKNYVTQPSWNLFFQDDIKLSAKLTLNLGLRYERTPAAGDKYGRWSGFVPELNKLVVADTATVPNYDQLTAQAGLQGKVMTAAEAGLPKALAYPNNLNFAPRGGLAWRPGAGNRTVIRAGYGIFYSGSAQWHMRNLLGAVFPYVVSRTFNSTKSGDMTIANPFPDTLGKIGVTNVNGTQVHPSPQYSQSWNLTVQREVVKGVSAELGYVGSKSTNLVYMYDINQPLRYKTDVVPAGGFPRPYPAFGTIGFFDFHGNAIYHAAVASVQTRMRGGLVLRASYTFGKAIDDGTRAAGLSASTGGFPGIQDARNRGLERGRSDSDRRHVLNGNFNLPLPFKHNRLIRGWQLSGTFRAYSGTPITPQISNVNWNLGEAARPDRIAFGTLPNPGPDAWFDVKAFPIIPTGSYRPGTSGRNILDGPGLFVLNGAIMRTFVVHEGQRVQFRIESFNATNHTKFNAPNKFVDQITAATISRAAPGRQTQISVQYIF